MQKSVAACESGCREPTVSTVSIGSEIAHVIQMDARLVSSMQKVT